MTTLTEFKEIEIHDMDDTEITRLYENALPALIAVAEGMENALKHAVQALANAEFVYMKYAPNGSWKNGYTADKEKAKQALAAYEAWKLNIEGEK